MRNVTLPFIGTLPGYCRVSNWLNFNTVMSQGIGRPERDKVGGDGQVGGTVRTQTFIH